MTTNTPVIVCLPGMTRNGHDFDDLAIRLADDYRVICPDIRGRGKSDYADNAESYVHGMYVQDIFDLLDHSQTESVVLIGTSFGGTLALRFAAQHPRRIKGIVLNDIGPASSGAQVRAIQNFLRGVDVPKTWQQAAELCRARYNTAYPMWTDQDWAAMARRQYKKNEASYIVPDFDPNLAVPYENGTAADNSDLWQVYDACQGIPKLIIRGALSQNLTEAQCLEMERAGANCKIQVVQNVGHAPTLVEPEALSAVKLFLDDCAK